MYLYNGTLLNCTEKWNTSTCYNVDGVLQEILKKSGKKGHIYYDFISIKCPEYTNLRRKKVD